MLQLNPIFLSDSYKLSHLFFEVKGTQKFYSNYTPRFTTYFEKLYPQFDGKIVWFGLQYAVKKILIDQWNTYFFNQPKEKVIEEARRILVPYIGLDNLQCFEALHDLGYLPIEIKGLLEGSLVTKGIPCFTISNTLDGYAWLVGYLETILINEIWKPMTVASVGRQFRLLANQYAMKTVGSLDGVDFQNHDFSFRSQSTWESSAINGVAFLLSSWGSDNIPAIPFAEYYYNADITKEPICYSVNAGEHSVTTLGINYYNAVDKLDGEIQYLRDLLVNKFPTGILSYVSDSYDYYSVLTKVLPALKEEIMSRDGKLVIRADSGNQVNITCGYKVLDLSRQDTYDLFTDVGITTGKIYLKHPQYPAHAFDEQVIKTPNDKYYLIDSNVIGEEISEVEVKGTIEILWDLFGGTITDKGYKLLDSHIGFIYGDGILWQKEKDIFDYLEHKGFASTNFIAGLGGYSLSSSISRDSLGNAFKLTQGVVAGKSISVMKQPKTDTSKNSLFGLLQVSKDSENVYTVKDSCTPEQEKQGALELVFQDGVLLRDQTLAGVKAILWS